MGIGQGYTKAVCDQCYNGVIVQEAQGPVFYCDRCFRVCKFGRDE